MDLPEAMDPNAPHHADRAAGTTGGEINDISGTISQDVGQDMVASLDDVKPSIRDFDGKREERWGKGRVEMKSTKLMLSTYVLTDRQNTPRKSAGSCFT